MDGAFKAQVVNIFEADSKFEAWLVKLKIWTAEDFALICSEERLLDLDTVKPAAADGVPMEIKDKVTSRSCGMHAERTTTPWRRRACQT